MKQIETKKPWQQWEDETDLAYSYFVSYLEMGGERSLAKVGQKHGKKDHYRKQLAKWSVKHDWVERCKAYDEHLVLRSLNKREQAIDMAHAKLLNMLDDALEEYADLIRIDNVIYASKVSGDENGAILTNGISTLNVKIKTIIDLLDRLGIDFSVKDGQPSDVPKTTYQQINNYFHQNSPNSDDDQ